ncbi:MAG: hypothetical protein A2315_02160 [Ignavibacteria bacterium RIFOXYB2_FULL_35_12]|nr:MAG: hypothetical protein A2492_03440 [Ignavibacteria bacterium RIFOXYC12_FULL_35_11]OGU91205.1 MAG: hypothetical protein A3K31_17225 [Ignavibacteria bacterium RIFOXYA12_FULL_35_25]OGU94217.1 MAG: hypothetical protein A2347_12825 [Ignavibacteria bacterium RIFOXYB12_FULL_35_14]OGV00375.1 MAG: hypothetical protein A2455_05575 [Ignavibacteria bacterium RIFOXYC2_FULL_35_16]OGV04173.1 MAG: hypothetical protein A2315_02160 [Ignavibacteria bacterium RIFOXYB2_FULL_35_12]OGV28577.1 MAG: hypothetical
MKTTLTALVILLYNIIVYSQVNVEWIQMFNGIVNAADRANSVTVDVLGNVYVTGQSVGDGTNYDYATVKYNSAGIQQWAVRYNGPGNRIDKSNSIVVDDSGNVYVTGSSRGNGTLDDYATIKYNTLGVEQWVARYNGPESYDDFATSIAIDGFSNVYVTGISLGLSSDACATIKYNSEGAQQWVKRYNSQKINTEIKYFISIDNSGYIYVTGSIDDSGNLLDYATIKYNSSGTQQWVAKYNGPERYNDIVTAHVLDDSANVYVTGYSRSIFTDYDYATVKFNSSGIQQWVSRYNSPGSNNDFAASIALDGLGNVFVTGSSPGPGTKSDYTTIKYNLTGVQQWIQKYDRSANSYDYANSLATDGSGNVYVTGYSFISGTSDDYATIKYNPSGVLQWFQTYNGSGNKEDQANSIAVDSTGNVYVTGLSIGSVSNYDYATIKYIQSPNTPNDLSATAVSASTIELVWIETSKNEIGFKVERSTNADTNWLSIDSVAQNIVTYTDTNLSGNKVYYYRIYAYNTAGNSDYSNVALDTTFNPVGIILGEGPIPANYSLNQNYPNPFNPSTKISWRSPVSSYVSLKVFDVLGNEIATLVDEYKPVGNYEVEFSTKGGQAAGSHQLSSGVYYYQLKAGEFVQTKKLILMK